MSPILKLALDRRLDMAHTLVENSLSVVNLNLQIGIYLILPKRYKTKTKLRANHSERKLSRCTL